MIGKQTTKIHVQLYIRHFLYLFPSVVSHPCSRYILREEYATIYRPISSRSVISRGSKIHGSERPIEYRSKSLYLSS